MNHCIRAALLALSLWVPVAPEAADLAVVAGEGDGVRSAALAIKTRNWKAGPVGDRWSYELAGEWQLARWSANGEPDGVSELFDASLTAVLTLRPAVLRPSYVEGGFGFHLLSDDHIGAERDLGWAFQFGEFIGAGVNFGARQRYAIGVRVQHVSNGSLKSTNDGVTFVQAVARCSF